MTSKPKMPEKEGPFVSTLNKMGYMVTILDPFSQAFVNFAASHSPVLDIGTAYGSTAQAALKNGSIVFANDLDKKHLEILQDQIEKPLKAKLHLVPGDVRSDLKFKDENFEAILCSRVLHFFEGDEIRKTLQHFFRWLKPNGQVFIVCETPYLKSYSDFIPIFEKRREKGALWPGFIEDVAFYNQKRAQNLPKILNWMHPQILERELQLAGFEVLKSDFIARPYFPKDLQYDGRESCGAIGRKPSSSY